jgi:hypothetical protein
MDARLTQHPLSAAFPAMSADDFAALVEDIKVNGQREPVIVFEGMVLDGWHRYSACVAAGHRAAQVHLRREQGPGGLRAVAEPAPPPPERIAARGGCGGVHRVGSGEPPEKGGTQFLLIENERRNGEGGERLGPHDQGRQGRAESRADGRGERGCAHRQRSGQGRPRRSDEKRVTAPAPAPAPEEQFGPSAEELAEAEREQAAEFAALRLLIEADDKLSTAFAEVKRLTALSVVLQSRVDGLMNEKNEAIRAAKSWQRKFEKASREGAPA